jgi:hypothetical protein
VHGATSVRPDNLLIGHAAYGWSITCIVNMMELRPTQKCLVMRRALLGCALARWHEYLDTYLELHLRYSFAILYLLEAKVGAMKRSNILRRRESYLRACEDKDAQKCCQERVNQERSIYNGILQSENLPDASPSSCSSGHRGLYTTTINQTPCYARRRYRRREKKVIKSICSY